VAIITVSLCAVLLIAGLLYWFSVRAREVTTDAYVTGHIDLVSARVPGTVQTVKVDDNQIVRKDDVLVQLDPNDLQVKVALARAGLDAAEQQAATAKTAITFSSQSAAAGDTQANGGVGQAEAGVARSQDMLREADADLERAALDDKRFENLLARHEVSQQQYDHTHTAYKIALANDAAATTGVREAEAGLARATGGLQAAHAALTDVDLRRKQHQSALANVEAAQAAYDDARLQLSYTVIHAPVGGRIGNKTVEVGQRVQPGQPLLAVVEPEVWVIANFKETQLAHMKDGQPAEVQIDRFPEKRFRTRAEFLSRHRGELLAFAAGECNG
jgi:membrane fusion protein (multidrug efflux system)